MSEKLNELQANQSSTIDPLILQNSTIAQANLSNTLEYLNSKDMSKDNSNEDLAKGKLPGSYGKNSSQLDQISTANRLPVTEVRGKSQGKVYMSEFQQHDDITFEYNSQSSSRGDNNNNNNINNNNIINSNNDKHSQKVNIEANNQKLKGSMIQDKLIYSNLKELSDEEIEQLDQHNRVISGKNLTVSQIKKIIPTEDQIIHVTLDEEKARNGEERRKILMGIDPAISGRRSIDKARHMSKRNEIEDINPLAFTEMMRKSEYDTKCGKIKRIIKAIDIVIAMILIPNLILSIIDNELYITNSQAYLESGLTSMAKPTLELFEHMKDREITSTENVLRTINCIISVTAAILLVFHYKYNVILLKLDKKLSEFDGIFSSGLYKKMSFEIVICLITYPPSINVVFSGKILEIIYVTNVNSIISVLVMSKLYLILRLIEYCSRWTTETAFALCRNYKVKPGLNFAIKCEMKTRPTLSLGILFIIALGILGFSMRTFEFSVTNTVTGNEGKKGINDLQNLANCIWLIICTMTTVGYGDFYPRSTLGRLVGVVACLIGMLVLSLTVVSLSSISEFTPEEKKAYFKLKKLFADDNLENKAVCVIKAILQMRKHTIKRNEEEEKSKTRSNKEKFLLLAQLKKDISFFKNDYKIANSYSVPVDEMLKRIENKLKDDIRLLKNSISQIQNIDKDLEMLADGQDVLQTNLRSILRMQEDVSKYLVNRNNEAFLEHKNMNRRSRSRMSSKIYTKEKPNPGKPMLSSHIKIIKPECKNEDIENIYASQTQPVIKSSLMGWQINQGGTVNNNQPYLKLPNYLSDITRSDVNRKKKKHLTIKSITNMNNNSNVSSLNRSFSEEMKGSQIKFGTSKVITGKLPEEDENDIRLVHSKSAMIFQGKRKSSH